MDADIDREVSLDSDPDLASLVRLISFRPEKGRIFLSDRRMVLLHADCLSALRRELIDSFGADAARGFFTRMGYASGVLDAEMIRRLHGDLSLRDSFRAGPWLHTIEGRLISELGKVDIDIEKGRIYVEAVWRNSVEVESHRMCYGQSAEPVCWMAVGRACGWTSTFLGRPVLFREIECEGAGGKACRIVGKPPNAWGDSPEDLRYLQSEAFVNLPLASQHDVSSAPPDPVGVTSIKPATGFQIVGISPSFNAASHLVRKVARTKANVLFIGETGVGKELFAEALHQLSGRTGPFVTVNCAAIPESLIESELFGVEKGAFTGALASRPGRFERADGGTLFLDEVGTLSFQAQGKLLRALQTGEIERVGDTRIRKVDVRIASATNENLKQLVRAGRFRSDLFYRLNVFPIYIPPLRERRQDLPLLMRYFLDKFSRLHGKHVTGFTENAIRILLDYDFPGNIRELENMIERGVILSSDNAPLDVFSLFSDGSPEEERSPMLDPAATHSSLPDLEQAVLMALKSKRFSFKDVERAALLAVVKETGGNLSAAARMIGVTRRQLSYRLKNAGRLDHALNILE